VNYPETHCGETLRGLPYGSGFALTLVGGAGADTLEGGDGTDLIYGDELAGVCSTSSSVGGSDRLDGFYGSNQLFGCGGPDTLRADYENTNLDDVLFGYSGNDCLETNATGIGSGVFDCGAGTADKYHAPFATTGCETSVVSCP
jgi:hypothetical protein